MINPQKRLLVILISIPLLLLIPLIAMQFSTEVNWTRSDFVIMGLLLLFTGLGVEMVLRIAKKSRYKWWLVFLVLFLFFLVYAEMAVGLFGSPIAGS